MQRRVLLVVCLLTTAVSGCKNFSPSSREPLYITRQEKEFAESLAHFSQGLIFSENQGPHSPEALKEYESAFSLAPDKSADYIIPHLLRYALVMQTNNAAMVRIDEHCTDYFTQKIKSGENTPLAYVTLARMHFKNNRDKEAITLLKNGINTLPDNEPIKLFCRLQGQDFFLKKEFIRAVSCFELLSNEESDDYERFHYMLGDLNALLGHKQKAIEHFSIASEGDDAIPDAYIMLAQLYYEIDITKAIETLEQASLKFQNNPKVLFYLANYYVVNNNYPEAVKAYQTIKENVEIDPDNVPTTDFYLAYGAAYEQMGELDQAEMVFQEGITNYPNSAVMLNYLAYMWADSNQKLDQALEYVNRALEIENNNGAYIDTLGWVYFRQNKYEESLKHLLDANELMPGDPTIMEHIGDVYKALNQKENAVKWWKSSYFADTENESIVRKLKAEAVDPAKLKKQKPNNDDSTSNATD